MSWKASLICALVVVPWMAASEIVLRAAEYDSLQEISTALSNELEKVFSEDAIKSSETYELLRLSRSFPLWRELLVTDQDPVLNVCGLFLISSEVPDAAFDAAVTMVLAQKRPAAMVIGYAAPIIAKGMPNRRGCSEIAVCSTHEPTEHARSNRSPA